MKVAQVHPSDYTREWVDRVNRGWGGGGGDVSDETFMPLFSIKRQCEEN